MITQSREYASHLDYIVTWLCKWVYTAFFFPNTLSRTGGVTEKVNNEIHPELIFCKMFMIRWKCPVFKDTCLERMGFPRDTVVKSLPANAGGRRDMGLIPGLGRSLGEWNGHSGILAWESHAKRSLVGYRLWDHKSQTHTHTHTHVGKDYNNTFLSYILTMCQVLF